MNASRVGSVVVALATAVVLVAVAILPFLSPAWVGFEQVRTGVAALTGYSASEVQSVTNAILADLVIGPPDFDVMVKRFQVLTEAERAHMRDVRGVFAGFYAAAALALVVVVAAFGLARRGAPGWTRADAWRAARRGAIGLGLGVVVVGVVAAVAFDAAFELFHRVFFPGGNFAFDPRTSRLVQLFPFAFWFETTIAVGAIIVLLAVATAWLGSSRLARLARPAAAGADTAASMATTPGAEPVP